MSSTVEYSLKTWDAIVIGSGIGGGIAGRKLAEAGLSVLFLEKGPRGYRTDQASMADDIRDPTARLVRGGWPDTARVTIDGVSTDTFLSIGAGNGGSSVFYAAALARPERHDLDHSDERPHPTGGWPVSFDNFRSYFDEAARIFHIHGTPDPLSKEGYDALATPPDRPAGDIQIADAFSRLGLTPYYTHTGIKDLPGCQHCFGFKCPRSCKMDGRSAGVEPALATGNAHFLGNSEVTRLSGAGTSLTHVETQVDGATVTFQARRYILAGGALGSARLLLASASKEWPEGCANSSGLVGRNLMFHLDEMVAIWPKRKFEGASRTIALRDFYYRDGQRFGMFQAMGIDVGYGEIVSYLNLLFDRSFLRHWKALRHFTRIPAAIGAQLFGNAKVFVGILEDLPYRDNRIELHPEDGTRLDITYQFSDELLARRKAYRKALRKSLRGMRRAMVGVEPMLNLGHPCGTAVFGNDPENSVLNADCRAHDLDNLYVVDASFMPTSMGVNPSLTIAANALRVADHLEQELKGNADG